MNKLQEVFRFQDLDRMKSKLFLMMLIVEQLFDVIYVMIVRNLVKRKLLNVRTINKTIQQFF